VASSTLSLLDPDRIEAIAEEHADCRAAPASPCWRSVCAVVLSAFEQGLPKGAGSMRSGYMKSLAGLSGSTSFRNMGRRMFPVMQTMLRRRVEELIRETESHVLKGRLAAFRDVLIPDGCVQARQHLVRDPPGTGQPAELKLHASTASSEDRDHVLPTAGSVHDSDGFWPERWEAGALYIYDLGYQSNDRFVEAFARARHLLQRLKETVNPVVVASYGPTGCASSFATRLADAAGKRPARSGMFINKRCSTSTSR
jgi:hypothetical protein